MLPSFILLLGGPPGLFMEKVFRVDLPNCPLKNGSVAHCKDLMPIS